MFYDSLGGPYSYGVLTLRAPLTITWPQYKHQKHIFYQKNFKTCYLLVAEIFYNSKCQSSTYHLRIKLFYKYKCPTFHQPRLGRNVIFSAPNWDIAPIFCADSPHKWVNILSVCPSVMLQKALLLMDVVILFFLSFVGLKTFFK